MTKTHMPIQLSSYRAVLPLALIYALRMLGLFLLLPLIALYAEDLAHATPTLMGIAFGVYGLTQALLQIPFGALSDRFGRKRLIGLGLLLFIVGSLLCAFATSIYGLIVGRALQGAGAISGVVIALVADLTPEKERTIAMAIIGISIGATFSLAFALSPLIAGWIGVSGLFILTAILAFMSLLVLYLWVPSPRTMLMRPVLSGRAMWAICKAPRLLQLDVSIFLLHMLLAITFIAVPFVLRDHLGLAIEDQGKLYLPVLFTSFFGLIPLLLLSRKTGFIQGLFYGAIMLLALSQLVLCWVLYGASHAYWGVYIGLWLFFVGFNFLEAQLPALVSKAAPVEHKGLALGVYSTAQFLGIFVGGGLGGLLLDKIGLSALFLVGAFICIIWLICLRGNKDGKRN